jgi:hypothetical protein
MAEARLPIRHRRFQRRDQGAYEVFEATTDLAAHSLNREEPSGAISSTEPTVNGGGNRGKARLICALRPKVDVASCNAPCGSSK